MHQEMAPAEASGGADGCGDDAPLPERRRSLQFRSSEGGVLVSNGNYLASGGNNPGAASFNDLFVTALSTLISTNSSTFPARWSAQRCSASTASRPISRPAWLPATTACRVRRHWIAPNFVNSGGGNPYSRTPSSCGSESWCRPTILTMSYVRFRDRPGDRPHLQRLSLRDWRDRRRLAARRRGATWRVCCRSLGSDRSPQPGRHQGTDHPGREPGRLHVCFPAAVESLAGWRRRFRLHSVRRKRLTDDPVSRPDIWGSGFRRLGSSQGDQAIYSAPGSLGPG